MLKIRKIKHLISYAICFCVLFKDIQIALLENKIEML